MSTTMVIARHQVQSLARRQTFVLMLGVLLLMTALSGFIGWSSHSTIINVYDETVRTLAAAGKPAPPNPFAGKPRLALLSTFVIYSVVAISGSRSREFCWDEGVLPACS